MRDPTVGINFNQCVHFPIRTAAHHYKSWPGLRPDAAGTGQTFAAADSALRNELLAERGTAGSADAGNFCSTSCQTPCVTERFF